MNAIFSLYEKACGLITRGWCISEKLDGKLVHKCLHLICRMSVVSTVSKFCNLFIFFPFMTYRLK